MAGMCLFDTMDGSFMNFAYGWAFSQPVRKVYYNITITSLSVIVAVLIGGIELLGLLADKFELTGGVWNLVGAAGGFQYTDTSWSASSWPPGRSRCSSGATAESRRSG